MAHSSNLGDAPSATTSPSAASSPPVELRRLTSNGNLAPHLSPRNSMHAGRMGSRSPAASIPSSPTSVHSSSSAIFERDVEPIASLTSPSSSGLSHHPSNPHLVPRGHATEAIEQSVPSVLDSAAELLTTTVEEDEQAVVVAPAATLALGSTLFGSPIRGRGGSPIRSRSPSPLGRVSLDSSLLLHMPSSTSPIAGSPPTRPSITTQNTAVPLPSVASTSARGSQSGTPTSAYFTSSNASSPTTTTADRAPSLPTPTHTSSFGTVSHSSVPATTPPTSTARTLSPSGSALVSPHQPPSPAAKRLSFMSYTDLLASTPASTLSLSSLTTSATAEAPPPHIPSVLGLAAGGLSPSHSLAGSLVGELAPAASGAATPSGHAGAYAHVGHAHGFGAAAASHAAKAQRESVLLDDVGGEWEREGLGMGLEERLEALMGPPAVAAREAPVTKA